MCPASGSADHCTCSIGVLRTAYLHGTDALIGHHGAVTTSASPHTPFVRVAGAILGLVALLAVLLVNASPASAHARLESSSPADGSTLTAVPPEVSLRFNEPIKEGLNEVSVRSGSTDVAEGKVEVEGNSVYQPVKYSMKPGKYTVTYKVVSADGHPVSGSVSFTYGPPKGDDGAKGEPGATTTSPKSDAETSDSSSGDGSGDSSSSDEESVDGESGDGESGDATSSPEDSSSSAGGTSEPSTTSSGAETSGEEPSDDSSTSSDTAAGDSETTSSEEGTSPWWWAAGAAALVVVLGAVGMLAKGRRGSRADEDVTDEDWRE